MIIRSYRVTCSVTKESHVNDAWFRDDAHFERVLRQWNAYQGPWKQRYESMAGVARGQQRAFN